MRRRGSHWSGSIAEVADLQDAGGDDSEIQAGPTFVVTTAQDTNDGACYVSDCSLRDAITAANAYTPSGSGSPTIAFNIPGSGVQTIQEATPLPAITAPVTIDATTQPLYGGTPLVVLNGSSLNVSSPGTLSGTGSNAGDIQSARLFLSGRLGGDRLAGQSREPALRR